MQAVSLAYKEEMQKQLRDHSYIRVTIGLINQEAQASAIVSDAADYTYYSNLKMPLDNYEVEELYATCDQDYTAIDGTMYFLPRNKEDVVLNAGIVTESLLGEIEINFPIQHDIKGLTIDFGKTYPVDFEIVSDGNTVNVSGNTDSRFVTDEIFPAATFLRFVPKVMSNGQSRFRIHQITLGIGIYFDNRNIVSATKKEYISPIMEEIPSIDFSLTVTNRNRAYDIENEESTVNFLEIGQEVSVLYGQELDDGSVEWQSGTTAYLREWSADDEEMSFQATDCFEDLDGKYYRGQYRKEGISLYELAEDVMKDAGIDSRKYWLDSYLKDVIIQNPIPVTTYAEALQLIANAGRCVLYQDRTGKIAIKSSFVPEMTATSENETYFSNAESVLSRGETVSYAFAAKNYTDVAPTQYFLPRKTEGGTYLNAGYVSEAVANEDGLFDKNPTLTINLEARYKCFGLTLEFGRNHPREAVFHGYLAGEIQESYVVSGITAITVVNHEFQEFDCLVIEFTKGISGNRVVLEKISFGDSTDYELSYGRELTKTPNGTQLAKIREVQVVRTLYRQDGVTGELAREVISVSPSDSQHTFYFSRPSYELSCRLENAQEGQTVRIIDSSNYYATISIDGVSGQCEVVVTGKEYSVSQGNVSKQLNPTGGLEIWKNPLVSETAHAADLADWVGAYMKADREYDLQYRGEPRIDANDIAFLENKYVPDLLIRIYEHTLKFNGALSGTIKARRDMSYVATAKNRLAAK